MKKIIAIALSLMLLCGAVSVFAETVPSKTTGDLIAAEVTVENPVEGKPVEMALAADTTTADAELAKLQEAGLDAYLGEEVAKGVADIVGEGANVDEFLPIAITGYEAGMGLATVTVQFATPYAEGEKVAVLIGMPLEDGQVAWSVFEGVGLADGRVQFQVPEDVMLAIVDGIALMAVCSL